MSELVVTTTTTSNGTTDHTIKTGNTTGPVVVVYANGYIGASNTTGSDFLIADANVSYSNTQKGVFRGNMSAGPIESMAIHNLIVNGGMEISQENGNTASNTNAYFPADQCVLGFVGHDANTFQDTETPSNNYTNSVRVQVKAQDASPAAGDYVVLLNDMEGTFTRKLGLGSTEASKITIGHWSRCSDALTYSVAMQNGANDRAYLKEYTLTGNTWTWNCTTIDGDTSGTWYSNTSTGLTCLVCLSTGSTYANATAESWIAGNYLGTTTQDNFMGKGVGNTFHTTGWVVIPGEHTISSADAHKFLLPYDYELQRCERYYETGKQPTAYYTSGGAADLYHHIEFRTRKRANPSMSGDSFQYWSGGGAASLTESWTAIRPTGATFFASGLTNARGPYGDNASSTWRANARM